ncbi:transposase family protein [Streptomyces halstedii]|uniref:transposase family protein n=1 Tax=Streptomyces halstedii TaxID=1944 RepID=UPI003461647C
MSSPPAWAGSPPPPFVLAPAACAVLTGAVSLAAIAEWAADTPPAVRAARGGRVREPTGPTAPAEATIRRVLQRVDGDAPDTAIGAWAATRDSDRRAPDQRDAPLPRRSLAVDGKTVRGARRTDGTQVHLLAAMTGTGLVTAQREVDRKTNEITVFPPLLAGLDLADTVVAFDACTSRPPMPASWWRTMVPGKDCARQPLASCRVEISRSGTIGNGSLSIPPLALAVPETHRSFGNGP